MKTLKKNLKYVQQAIRNLVASLDGTDAEVARLAELSRAHTDLIVSLHQRLSALEKS